VEDTADTVPPTACVVTVLTLLKSLSVDTQMLAEHPAAMLAAMVTPVRVTVTAVPPTRPPDMAPTVMVKPAETALADVPNWVATAVTPMEDPVR